MRNVKIFFIIILFNVTFFEIFKHVFFFFYLLHDFDQNEKNKSHLRSFKQNLITSYFNHI